MISRRTFIQGSVLVGTIALPKLAAKTNERPPALDRGLVNEFVKVAHTDLSAVQSMLDEQPHLLNASWDWGNGDFETAMGAAGHMGLKDTALYLLDKGARADIFVLTMLGKTDLVKGMLDLYPNLLESYGPHGFTLLHHAKQGGEDAAGLVEFFQSKGLNDMHRKIFQ